MWIKIFAVIILWMFYIYYDPMGPFGGLFGDMGSGMLVTYLCYFFIAMHLSFNRINSFILSRFVFKKDFYFWALKKILKVSSLYVLICTFTYVFINYILRHNDMVTIYIIVKFMTGSIINISLLNFIILIIKLQYNTIFSMIFAGCIITLAYITGGVQLIRYNISFIASAYTDINGYMRPMFTIMGYLIILSIMLILLSRNKKMDISI